MRPESAARPPNASGGAALRPAPVPSIRARLANALAIWSILWGLAVGAAAWLAAAHEVDELLDDTLKASAELLLALTVGNAAHPTPIAPAAGDQGAAHEPRYAWQRVSAQGEVLSRSGHAPEKAWHLTPTAGFAPAGGWRVYGLAATQHGQMLYVGQSDEERVEARLEVTLAGGLAGLAVGILGHLWLRSRVRRELQPLQSLCDQLDAFDWRRAQQHPDLGPAQRSELQPVLRAIEDLASRLSQHLATEQAFVAHAAHALRTPLAGIDAQLAVAVKESPEALRERLQRVRGGAARLQAVVAALMSLFRSDGELLRKPIELAPLLERLPVPRLQVEARQTAPVHADEDLVAAALMNLLDNAVRHGAQRVWIEATAPQRITVRDDGPGVSGTRRDQLREALAAQSYEGATGLGLMLADRVARAHGGQLQLPPADRGFELWLDLGPVPALATTGPAASTPTRPT